MKLKIAYFYPDLLNLYGDRGNVEILYYRAKQRGIDVEVELIKVADKIDTSYMDSVDIVLMGGGPDSSQQGMYLDLLENKGNYLKEYIEKDGYGLYICGSYQLFGNYYKASDGSILEGLKVFDMYTQHFGKDKPRCIGNVVCKLNANILEDPYFSKNNIIGDTLVGFENHGGRTYLSSTLSPLGTVVRGHGNNSEDRGEGLWYKKSIGTYFHGPILSRNPHLADYLIAASLELDYMQPLEIDNLIKSAHLKSLKHK